MNKTELVKLVAELADITKTQAERAINATFDSIKGALKDEKVVQLIGFGSFSVSERAARQGINPQTREPITIPASKVVKFKAGKDLKDEVN